MTPEFLMKAHGLDENEWEVVSYKNNLWHAPSKDDARVVMYQSKLTVKPISKELSEKDIDRIFETKRFKYDKPLTKALNYNPKGEVLEICSVICYAGLS